MSTNYRPRRPRRRKQPTAASPPDRPLRDGGRGETRRAHSYETMHPSGITGPVRSLLPEPIIFWRQTGSSALVLATRTPTSPLDRLREVEHRMAPLSLLTLHTF